MGLRDWMNGHPTVATTFVGGCLLLCGGGVAYQMFGGHSTVRLTAPEHYYSADDGKTFFTAPGDSVAPFDYHGQTAVRAYVFNCGSGTPFVGYLERYTPESRVLELGPQRGSIALEANGREVKRPGDATWVSSKDRKAEAAVERMKCPAGSADLPVPIEP